MVPCLRLEMLELERSLPFTFAEPWFLTLAFLGSHPLARGGAAGRNGAAGGRLPRAL